MFNLCANWQNLKKWQNSNWLIACESGIFPLTAKRKVFLAEITDTHNHNGCEKLAENGIPAEQFNQEFKQKVINAEVWKKADKVANELNSSP